MQHQSEAHRLRYMVKTIHHYDLLLLDGEGTLEKPFIIDPATPLGDYITVENDTIVYHFMYGGYAGWQKTGQKLIFEEERILDRITVAITALNGDSIVSATRTMYFDITTFFPGTTPEEENPDEVMRKMKDFVDKLNEETEKK